MFKFQWVPDRDDSPRHFFSSKEKKEIHAAIADLEKKTSAELRVHVERRDLKISIFDQARRAFEKLGMTQTRDRNGVLIFLCSDSHEFAVLGDAGINAKVPENFWKAISEEMAGKFKSGLFSAGVSAGIELAGKKLRHFFPLAAGDKNELSNDVSHAE